MVSQSIREILDSLASNQKAQLMYAFENSFSQRINLTDGSFIGVNIEKTDSIEIIQAAGFWTHAISI